MNFPKKIKKALTPTLISVFSVGTMVCMYFGNQANVNYTKLSASIDNVRTCFLRVHQTYTAKLISDNSSLYLNEEFQKLTEECFAEVTSQLEQVKSISNSAILNTMNLMKSEIHWFHEKIGGEEVSILDVEETSNRDDVALMSNLSRRFEKLEIKSDQLVDEIDNERTIPKEKSFYLRLLTVTFSLLTFGLCLVAITRKKRKEQKSEEIESKSKEMLKSGEVENDLAKSLVNDALKTSNFIQTGKLFNKIDLKSDSKVSKKPLVQFAKEEKNQAKVQVREIWENSEEVCRDFKEKEIQTKKVSNLERTVADVIDHLSSILFTQGVKVGLDIPSDILVYGEKESLEQVIYHCLLNSVRRVKNTESSELTLKVKKMGSIAIVEIKDFGRGYSDKIIELANLHNGNVDGHMDLLIAKELMEDDGKIVVENFYDENGKTKGGVVRLILKIADGKKRVKSVMKGKKKDIQALISA